MSLFSAGVLSKLDPDTEVTVLLVGIVDFRLNSRSQFVIPFRPWINQNASFVIFGAANDDGPILVESDHRIEGSFDRVGIGAVRIIKSHNLAQPPEMKNVILQLILDLGEQFGIDIHETRGFDDCSQRTSKSRTPPPGNKISFYPV
jgi:hypothetical protein